MLLIFSFRKTKNILLIGVAILFGWLFAMGFTAVLRSDVSLIVLGIGSIIIGIAVNYPLHFVAHIDHGGSVRETLKEMVPPLLIGNITTVGAFASLIPLDAPALRDLGLFAVFMLLGTILFGHLVNMDDLPIRTCRVVEFNHRSLPLSFFRPRLSAESFFLIIHHYHCLVAKTIIYNQNKKALKDKLLQKNYNALINL